MHPTPLISVVIRTVGRPSLQGAVANILDQETLGGNVKVKVINDSGCPLEVASKVLNDPRVTVITTNRRDQSIARNVGAAVARRQYLLSLDDDDWLVQGGLVALLEIMRNNPNPWWLLVAWSLWMSPGLFWATSIVGSDAERLSRICLLRFSTTSAEFGSANPQVKEATWRNSA